MAETGQPYGRTQYSEYPEQLYEKHRADRQELSASEYAVVIQGFMREYVCMGQCNIYYISAQDPELKEAIGTYLGDVCDPNIAELQQILEGSGYELPASLQDVASLNELEDIDTKAIDDQMITVAQWFATRAFMELWNTGAIMSQRTDVRDAFLRNYHRANRWHVAFYDMAVEKGYLAPLPNIEAGS